MAVEKLQTTIRGYSGKIVAENVPYEDYLAEKYGQHVEWIFGVVIEMSPVSKLHDALSLFLAALFDVYLELTTGGRVLTAPMVMRPGQDFPAREPDVQVLLPDRMQYLQENQMAGPANLVVEIVSPESMQRDRGEKFGEYERGGVQEYWILDPVRKESLFYVLGQEGLFYNQPPQEGIYTSSVLDKLKLDVNVFWREKLPTTREVVQMVEQMLKDE